MTQERVKAAADAMVSTGLINHGWTYINIDDFWEKNQRSSGRDPSLGGVGRDESGKIVPNPRFPDMKGLCDYIHSLGLKAGIYSSPGPTTCGGCEASWQHEDQDAQSYADWGFDYLKYDWCSYQGVVSRTNFDGSARTNNFRNDLPTLKKPYQVMRTALNKVPRDIMFSLCQYGMGKVWEWGASDPTVGGNSWRTTGDIQDNWRSLSGIGFSQFGHEKFAGPGHFNDPDMMVVGHVDVGSGAHVHPTRLTPNEQYTHVSLWCLLTGPLLLGCDMTALDDFTLSLLSNDEVLAVSQDPLARQAGRVSKETAPWRFGPKTWKTVPKPSAFSTAMIPTLLSRPSGPTWASTAGAWCAISGGSRIWASSPASFKRRCPHGVVLVKVLPLPPTAREMQSAWHGYQQD